MNRVEHWLTQELGLRSSSIGEGTVTRAVHGRMRALGITDEAEYCARLGTDTVERQALTEGLVIAESWFFRNPESFLALRALAEAHRGGSFRVLCVPCASGEEPYSIAMTLYEAGLRRDQVRIDAVDISKLALTRAAAGIYSKNAFREPAFAPQHQYFTQTPQGHQLAPTIRSLVSFAHGNLASEAFRPRETCYDVVFCRNLLIYLDDAAQRSALQRLRSLLSPTGHLFLGPAESLLAAAAGFRAADFPMAFVCRPGDASARSSRELAPPRPAVAVTVATDRTAPAPSSTRRPRTPVTTRVPAQPDPVLLPLAEVQRLADAGELIAALEAARAFVARYDTSAEGWYTLALVYDAMARPVPAAECYRKVRFLDPDHHDAGLLLALTRQTLESATSGAGE